VLTIPEARSLLRRTRPQRSCDGYPAEVRTATTDLAWDLLDEGWSHSRIARDLGLSAGTLTRWLEQSDEPQRGFVPVFVPPMTTAQPSCTLSVVSPAGYRIEGLDLDGAIAALARLS